MTTGLKKFEFIFHKWNQKHGGVPREPYGHIDLVQWTRSDDSSIHLTPELANEKEVDCYVDALIANLELVRKSAKKKLAQ